MRLRREHHRRERRALEHRRDGPRRRPVLLVVALAPRDALHYVGRDPRRPLRHRRGRGHHRRGRARRSQGRLVPLLRPGRRGQRRLHRHAHEPAALPGVEPLTLPRAVIGLGANLGDRLATMRAAVARIDAIAPVVARSRVYETAPVGGPPQPDYLNAAVLVEWGGEPIALLDALLAIEHELGRVRAERNGPRTIDLDVLWMQNANIVRAVNEPRLVVPHPRLHERAFALLPFLDVVPGAAPRPDYEQGCRVSPYSLG
ncbi:MAG: 2-amino-4-hydroxy-6-hydroxymethyldihydropteridine diphosphokinase [Labilithrix sp.]|nr:2-amino-4-hydroxy-6-hydroxymethyldihydropteridine diphosphokinase [Labilithrix sp.]MCW5817726.1 2-amino-4-hydroxy-6-hydroxymethyldihydropteridine diphosphokinase [Labilithrix sp.]